MKLKILLFFFCLPFLTLAQDIPSIVSTLEIDTLLNNGPKHNRINLAFANLDDPNNNGYKSKAALNSDINAILARFNPESPIANLGFSQYRNFFNIQQVWFPDPLIFETVPSFYQAAQGVRDNLFLPWANDEHGWVTMIYTLDAGGGGGAGVVRERRVGDAYIFGLDWETVLHEFNHTMPGVLDEYTASGEWSGYVCLEGPNTSGALVLEDVPWRKWVDEDTPIPTPYEEEYFDKVGVFEGTISGYFGCHRPTARGCYMGAGGFGENYGQEMCVICLQRFICMMYQYVNVIENPSPSASNLNVSGNQSMSFSADMVKPVPNTQKYEWFLNGKLIAKNVESVSVDFGDCDNYELTLVVTDTTESVRYDEKFADRYPEPKQSRTWYINQSDVNAYDLSANIENKDADCTGFNSGQLEIAAQGGKAPYAYFLNGEEITASLNDLAPGDYSLAVVDDNNCGLEESFSIGSESILDFEIESKYDGNSWILSPRFLQNAPVINAYQWSDGQSSSAIEVTAEGTYSLNLTTATGCTVSKSIDLENPASPLDVSYELGMASNGAENGGIYLNTSGGREPYAISWYEGTAQDQTSTDASRVISSGNDEIDIHPSRYAFDNRIENGVDFWAEGFTGQNYIGYNFGTPTQVESYTITSNYDVRERDAKDWQFQGSNDGQNWTTLDQQEGINFPFRLYTQSYFLDEAATYQYYRIFITANQGDNWLAIQEVEFGALVYTEIKTNKNQPALSNVRSGSYRYLVRDENQSTASQTLFIADVDRDMDAAIKVKQEGYTAVAIENPNSELDYFWFADKEAQSLLQKGTTFEPAQPGNYYVRALDRATQSFGEETKGFAVKMLDQPVVVLEDNTLKVENPKDNYSYIWYDQESGGNALYIGTEFIPNTMGTYYVSARMESDAQSSIDPLSIPGLGLWMDASDLDGNGETDPTLENSAAYKWRFRTGGRWDQGSWFPYRGNYQNGLGVVDFATLWFQYLDGGTNDIRTFILAYEENDLSFPNSAPIYGLVENMPKHSDNSRLFSRSAPNRTLNGKVFLNGDRVNPNITANPLDFMVLGVVMTENSANFTLASHEFWEGKIGEILIWDKALSDSEMEGVNEYLRKKWLSTADLESPRTAIQWDLTTDVEDLPFIKFELFPNPNQGRLFIQSSRNGQWTIQISDLAGRRILQAQMNSTLKEVDISNFKNGIYQVQLLDQEQRMIFNRKLVKID